VKLCTNGDSLEIAEISCGTGRMATATRISSSDRHLIGNRDTSQIFNNRKFVANLSKFAMAFRYRNPELHNFGKVAVALLLPV
jgi:hypothetical protein